MTMEKRMPLFFVLTAILCALIIGYSLYQARVIERETPCPTLMPHTPPAPPQPERTYTAPSNPADYGMMIMSDRNRPRNQEQWDALMSEKITELKKKQPQQIWQDVKEKTKLSQEEYDKKIKVLEERIRYYTEQLKSNPHDDQAKAAIERMMMIKGIQRALRETK